MKIEVGKKYRDVFGHRKIIVSRDDDVSKESPFRDHIGYWYSEDGFLFLPNHKKSKNYRLIEEITE